MCIYRVYIHTCIYIYIVSHSLTHTHTHTHIHARTHTHSDIHTYTHIHTDTYIHTHTNQVIQAACLCHASKSLEAVSQLRQFLDATNGWARQGFEDACEAYIRAYTSASTAGHVNIKDIHATLGGKFVSLDGFLKAILYRRPGHIGTLCLVGELMLDYGKALLCVILSLFCGIGSDVSCPFLWRCFDFFFEQCFVILLWNEL